MYQAVYNMSKSIFMHIGIGVGTGEPIFGEGWQEYGFGKIGKIVPKYHGLCKSFVKNLIASGGFAPWTPIKI